MENKLFREMANKFWRYATVAILLGGCSSNMTMPWSDKFLDPGRIATREPLEIPPDLDVLPSANTQKDTDDAIGMPWNNSSRAKDNKQNRGKPSASTPNTSVDVPFNIPENQDDTSISRTKQEKLPAWME